MSKEIKFRGKSLKTREWLFGSLWIEGEKYYIIHGPNLTTVTEVDPNTVGQYIGLKDKNGREIYEGDIVSTGHRRGVVAYDSKDACFIVEKPNSLNIELRFYVLIGIEVVGNIHDNPELIKK